MGQSTQQAQTSTDVESELIVETEPEMSEESLLQETNGNAYIQDQLTKYNEGDESVWLTDSPTLTEYEVTNPPTTVLESDEIEDFEPVEHDLNTEAIVDERTDARLEGLAGEVVEEPAGSGCYVEVGLGSTDSLIEGSAGGTSLGVSVNQDGLDGYKTETIDGWSTDGIGGGLTVSAGCYSDKNLMAGESHVESTAVQTPFVGGSVGVSSHQTPDGMSYGNSLDVTLGAGLNPFPLEYKNSKTVTTF